MSLSDLPDDILGLISIRLNGFDNCSLWMASDSKLKRRLVNNVISDFDIKYSTPGRFIWPGNFLKKLKRLSRLSLVVDKDVTPIRRENIELYPIETLKDLKIDCENLERILKQPQFDDSCDSTGPTTSSKDHKYINLNSLYPNLEHFEIGHSLLYLHANLSIDLLRFLPKKLKTFISYPCLVIDPKSPHQNLDMYIASLPHSLTSLNLHFHSSNPPIDASFLPPNLTSLTTGALIEEKTYSKLPQTLKRIDFCVTHYDVLKLSPFLPAGLESFIVFSSSIIGQSLAHLEHLESLKVFFPEVKYDVSESEDARFITKLPPNLKNCRFYYDGTQKLNLPPFPHGLVDLSLHTEREYTREFFASLPPTITKLSLLSRESQAIEYFQFLPKNLRSFETNLAILDNLSSLPESLTYLGLSPLLPPMISEDDRFPPKLEKLILDGTDLPKSVLKALPENLKSLQLISESMVDDEVIAGLSRGLTQLILETPLHLTDASAGSYPPNLERLQFIGDESVVIEMTDQAIGQVPRSLKYLDLANVSSLTDNCIKDLPRQLTHLSLTECTSITWRCCKDLPNCLYRLNLRGSKDWTVDSLKDLPKCLKYFDVGDPDVKLAFQSRK